MEIDRRSFLRLGAGVGAGITLSPVMWKLMDDSVIWTQNWSWTPVPPDGKSTYVNTVCTLCPGGCGITVRKVGQRVIKIEGMKGHPVSNGGICTLGLAGPQLLYSPARIKTPLIKRDGAFSKISWSEAIEIIARKLTDLRANSNAHTVACITDTDKGTIPGLFKRFLTAYGSPNFISESTAMDAYALTLKKIYGTDTVPGYDLENATYVLSFGSGLLDGWGSPVKAFQANSKWKKDGRKLVQIDPRLSNTAAKADRWLPINPGTEGVLALGLAHVILKSGGYNSNFLTMNLQGFEEWKDIVLNQYSPEKVQEITGIDITTIREVASEFKNSPNSVALCGRGEGAAPGSIQEIAAIHALNILVGSVNRKGGVQITEATDNLSWPELAMDAHAAAGMNTNRIDDAQSNAYPDTKYRLNTLPEMINSKNTPVNLLFVVNSNPVYTLPDTKTVKSAFGKIDYKISFSSYMDETAAMCDLILPNHSYLERYEDVVISEGLPRPMIELTRPVVKPQLDTRHTGDVIIALAKSMKGSIANSFPWNNYSECLKQSVGLEWSSLEKNGYIYNTNKSVTGSEPPMSLTFLAPEKNAQRMVTSIEGSDEYKLTLIPSDSMRIAGNEIGTPPFLVKTISDEVLMDNDILVEINPETANKERLTQGKYAVLSTPRCKEGVKVKIFLNDGIRPGVISIPRGLGHTAYDKYLAGKGINFNQLIGPVVDPASGLDVAWGIRASLKS